MAANPIVLEPTLSPKW